MEIRSVLSKILRTRSRRTLVIAGAAVVVGGGVTAFAAGSLGGAAGGGARWVVERVVHAMAWREVAPEGGTPAGGVTATSRVQVASKADLPVPADDPSGPARVRPEEITAPADEKPAPPLDIPAPTLVTPLEEEKKDPREDLTPYRSFGLRDPMVPLVTPTGGDDDERFSVHTLTLVGIARQGGVRVALCEDPQGKSYLYRAGEWTDDGGRVVEITEDTITFAHVRYGETNNFSLRLEAREEEH